MKRTMWTVTAKGSVHHQMHFASGLTCPVKVALDPRGPRHLPTAVGRDGKLVYALPGGGEFDA